MGGGKGGGSAGEIGFPAYMERIHQNWLDDGADLMTVDMQVMMQAIFDADTPFDPTVWGTANPAIVMGAGFQVLTPFQAVEDLDALNLTTLFTTSLATLDDTVARAAIVAAEAALLDARMTADILPGFQRAMRNDGAVLTTGFTIGEANIRAQDNLAVAKLDTELRLQSRRISWELSFRWVQLTIEWNRIVAVMATEVAIRYLESRYKVDQLNVEMAAKDALFYLEVYQYGGNMMAAISGASVKGQPESSMINTALGGVLSGASAGAQIGKLLDQPAAGAMIGGLLGLSAAIF